MYKIILVLLLLFILQSVSVSSVLYDGTDSFYNKLNSINQSNGITSEDSIFCNPYGIYFTPKNKKQKVLEYKVKPYMYFPSSLNDITDSFAGFDAKIFFYF